MRLLLDTHVLIDLVNEELDSNLEGQFADARTFLHVSVASLWEMAIKVRLGKLALRVPLDSLPELINATRMTLIEIKASHALAVADPRPETRDPFDRLLLAQCMIEGLQLATDDRALIAHPLAWKRA
ncbi:MAG TPA: type II toxin-antitoxin system VapC family toxin [Micropepsaceae bacterium]|nr:type II toxin-antitoxin system VapC family toxin [Micropepsaceae bacterium]